MMNLIMNQINYLFKTMEKTTVILKLAFKFYKKEPQELTEEERCEILDIYDDFY